jgi:hypothetical protein
MRSLLALILFYALISLCLIASGAVLGFFLHWIIPAVDLGTGILIGVITTGFSIYFFLRLMSFLGSYEAEMGEDEGYGRIMYFPLPPPSPRRSRKRKAK